MQSPSCWPSRLKSSGMWRRVVRLLGSEFSGTTITRKRRSLRAQRQCHISIDLNIQQNENLKPGTDILADGFTLHRETMRFSETSVNYVSVDNVLYRDDFWLHQYDSENYNLVQRASLNKQLYECVHECAIAESRKRCRLPPKGSRPLSFLICNLENKR